ncbi:FAD/NAD(P)-binding domain-containing protein [Lophiostoma macrostomum CBS 122681]|uniref:FAD/NAD(P)-binding domain-containing protein n=1 Tax=Lophiostoma macrostomum CBS 122681 TaxID=1314788 RepID=A0A6A6TK52_9PLEO|nr:FAD/NAD(P)-binding domain-containing protein [Lophiostoma macrostomum CBS 122681]
MTNNPAETSVNGDAPVNGEPPKLSIAIVGGGIVGVVLAHGLLHRGVQVAIYERAPNFHEIGAGFAFTGVARECMTRLSPAVIEAMNCVGVPNKRASENYWDGFHNKHSPTNADRDQNDGKKDRRDSLIGDPDGNSCELLFVRENHQLAFWGCLRAQFLDQLASSLAPNIAHFNKEFSSYIDPSPAPGPIRLHFTDGTSATADAIIGCDGLRSRVRAQLLADTVPNAILPSYTHKRCYRTLVPRSAGEAAIGTYKAANQCCHMGPGAHVITYPVNDTLLNVALFHTDPLPWPDPSRLTLPGRRSDILAALQGWGPAILGLANLFPPEPLVWAIFDMYEQPAPSYTAKSGRVCIAGDAAHASSPHHGAGAGFGIEDALAIATVAEKVMNDIEGLKARYLAAAFQAYNDTRYERTQWLVRSSHEGGQIYEWEYAGSRDNPDKVEKELDERFKVIWDFDVQSMVEEVQTRFYSVLAGDVPDTP